MKSFFVLIAIFMASVHADFAQKPADYGIKSKKAMEKYLEGRQMQQARDYMRAIDLYKEAIALEPNFAEANFSVGEAFWAKQKYADAIPFLLIAAENPLSSKFPTVWAMLGDACFATGAYEKATNAYEKFLENPKGLKIHADNTKTNLPKAKFAAEGMKHPVAFAPVNLGDAVNTEGQEYAPFLTADDRTLLFTARRADATGGFDNYSKTYPEDIYLSELKDKQWQPSQNISAPVNTPYFEGAASITQDGKVVFFAADYTTGLGGYDIYYSMRTNSGKWSAPQNLGENVNSISWDSQPFMAPDGKTLYFSSGRPGGLGGTDIWFTKWDGKKWLPAQNLGAPINSAGREQCPFIHADGHTLYFSSDGHLGFGGIDLFVSYFEEGKGWSVPLNMGYPLNTTANESGIFVNTKGSRGLIHSDRAGGFGGEDIYEFVIDNQYRPQISTFLRGVVKDSLTQQPLAARIKLVDVQTGDTVRAITTGKSDGKFLMSLPMNREYAAFAEAAGYLFSSKNFYLKDLKEDIYFDVNIALLPIPKSPPVATAAPVTPPEPVIVVLRNIFFNSASFELRPESYIELDVLLSYLESNPRMKIEIQGHTDEVGSDATNLTLSQNRANSVRSYLLGKGISPSRITAVGYGESQPIAPNDTEEGRAQNRRTAFQVLEI